MKYKRWWALLWAVGVLTLPSLTRVAAGEQTKIRLATLAPAGSSWDRLFRAWSNSLKKETDGALEFQIFAGGVAGDERDVIRKMRLGQMDAGAFTSIGLGQIVRPLLVLQMPTIVDNYRQLNHVRDALASDFEKMFDGEGYTLLGWGDVGFARQFSKRPILKPEDLKAVRPWVPRDDPTLAELMKIVGANGIPLGIPEVFPALQTGMVDAVNASAIAAVALQWFRHLTHVSKQATIALVGAVVLRNEVFRSFAPDHQMKLRATAKKAQAALIDQIQKEDQKAYKTLVERGLVTFDAYGTNQPAWDKVNAELVTRLTGRLWSKELLDRVRAKAKEVK